MNIYPAIDLMDGRAVRLFKGEKESKKVYGDPLKMAEDFSHVVDKIHVIDLDGAFQGGSRNLEVVESIIAETGLKVQLGGGFRDIGGVRKAYSAGVENVIIGTKAFDFGFLRAVTDEFDGITVSLDCRAGKIALSGWEEQVDIALSDAYDMVRKYVDRMIYTDIEKDGTLDGISLKDKFWDDDEMIYAGGVTGMEDIVKLNDIGFSGVIIGKAIYEGNLNINEVMEKIGELHVG